MTFFSDDDHTVPPDTLEVLEASALLQITEFHLFELAYERWFGRPAREEELEGVFARYMFASVAPPWVRQFCRAVADSERRGHLDPLEFGVQPRVVPDTWLRKGLRHTAALATVIITMHLIAILVSVHG